MLIKSIPHTVDNQNQFQNFQQCLEESSRSQMILQNQKQISFVKKGKWLFADLQNGFDVSQVSCISVVERPTGHVTGHVTGVQKVVGSGSQHDGRFGDRTTVTLKDPN